MFQLNQIHDKPEDKEAFAVIKFKSHKFNVANTLKINPVSN